MNPEEHKREKERRFLFYVSFFSVFFQILAHGNHELLFGFLLGSMLCCLLVFEGMNGLFSNEGENVSNKKIFFGKKFFFGKKIFLDKKEKNIRNIKRERSYFFSFSVILALILSADYLFFRRTGGNQMSRFDGGVLFLMLFVFLWTEVRNKDFIGNLAEWRQSLTKEKNIVFFIIKIILKMICICVAGYFLVDWVIGFCMKHHIRYSLAGVLFLSWVVQGVNVIFGRNAGGIEEMCDSMTFDVIFLFLCSFGLWAVLSPLSISYEEIISLIVMSILSIFMVWRDKVSKRIAGSLMLTLYVAGVIFFIR